MALRGSGCGHTKTGGADAQLAEGLPQGTCTRSSRRCCVVAMDSASSSTCTITSRSAAAEGQAGTTTASSSGAVCTGSSGASSGVACCSKVGGHREQLPVLLFSLLLYLLQCSRDLEVHVECSCYFT